MALEVFLFLALCHSLTIKNVINFSIFMIQTRKNNSREKKDDASTLTYNQSSVFNYPNFLSF
jgi:hypothetical protein